MTNHKYSIATDDTENCLKLICNDTGEVVYRGIDGRESGEDFPSHFKAWKQANRIRDDLESA